MVGITNALFGSIAEPSVAAPPAKPTARRLRRAKTPAAVKEQLLADVLENPQKYPEWRQDSALSAAVDLLRQRDRIEGKPVVNLSPAGGLAPGLTCSATWFTDNWEGTVFYPLGAPYPPGGDETRMVRCRKCGSLVPPIAMTLSALLGRVCLDCLPVEDHDGYGSSPSGAAIQTIRSRGAQPEMIELPAESASALRREIKRYHATGRMPK